MDEVEQKQAFDVAIVGFGPVGAVATCLLAQYGFRVIALDKSTTIWDKPRAVAIDHEILRLMQNVGIAKEVLEYTAPFPASEHFGVHGQLIRRIDAVSPPHPMGYVPTMVFTQPKVEAILRERAKSYANATVELGVEVVHVRQDDKSVHLTLQNSEGGSREVAARYAIACDGASSSMRQMLEIRLDDLVFDEPWLVVDVKVSERGLMRLPKTAAQYCDPRRPSTFVIGPGNHRRWEIMLLPGEDLKDMESPENVWRLLSPWLSESEGELWRASSYRFHALVAEEWRRGRVFLAGDAAHQQPPFIGQGMCQGIRDAANLTWKLHNVVHLGASQVLLDTYQQERSGHVRTLTTRVKAIGQSICERDPQEAALRDALLLKQGGGVAPTITRQEIVPPIETGLLVDSRTPPAGTLFPQPLLANSSGNELMDDVLGFGWRLIVDGRCIPSLHYEPADWLTIVALNGEHGLAEMEPLVSTWFDRYAAIAALVRPDHYVYGVANDLSSVRALISELSEKIGLSPPKFHVEA